MSNDTSKARRWRWVCLLMGPGVIYSRLSTNNPASPAGEEACAMWVTVINLSVLAVRGINDVWLTETGSRESPPQCRAALHKTHSVTSAQDSDD